MYIEKIPNRKSPPCILLRECYRKKDKVIKRTLANLTKWPPNIVKGLRILLKGGSAVEKLEECFEVTRSLPHGHVSAVLGTIKKLGLEKIIHWKRTKERNLVIAMITMRILNPCSKLATARGLDKETASNSLFEECYISSIKEDDLYNAMDWILPKQEAIENVFAKKHLYEGTVVLYDLTSTYFEGKTCPLAKLGYPRDNKKNKLQIEIGLLCDLEGRPISIEVFEGNVSDSKTVSNQIKKIRKRFNLEQIIIVGDRGMLTKANIKKEFKTVKGIDWITALRSSTIKKLIKNGEIKPSVFDEKDLAEIISPEYPGERLIVCKNPVLALERRKTREELLKATEKELEKIVKSIQGKRNPLRGKAEIGLKAGRVLNHYKVGKHFKLKITYASLKYERNVQKVEEEAILDGFYVIRTNVDKGMFTSEKTVAIYKNLAVVERAFRSLKTVDLKIRPVYHRLERRVKSHAFICMLAYYVEWHMRKALAPLLFDDEEKEIAQMLRKSIVAPAKRSPKAQAKAQKKRTEDGFPVHSFQTLLDDLATIAKDTIQPKIADAPTFIKITQPTLIQKKAFELLGIKI